MSPVAATNTLTETDLLGGAVTIDAGAMGASRLLRLRAWGDWLQNSGASQKGMLFRVKLGGTTLLDTNAFATSAGAACVGTSPGRLPWWADVTIANAGAANSQTVSGLFVVGLTGTNATVATAFTTGEGAWIGPAVSGSLPGLVQGLGFNTAAIDTTVAKLLEFKVINPTATSCETKLYGSTVEVV